MKHRKRQNALIVLAGILVMFIAGCPNSLVDTIEKEVQIVVTPPSIVSIYPESGAVSIPVDIDNILMTFTKQIDSSSVNNSSFMTKDSDGNTVSGTYSVSNDTIAFNPNSNLAYNTIYTITAKSVILDIDGNTMSNEFSWTFTTEDAPVGIKPIVQYVRINGDQSATNNTTVSLDISATDHDGNIQGLKAHYRISGISDWSVWTDLNDGILVINGIVLGVSVDGDIGIIEVEVKNASDTVSSITQSQIIYDISAPVSDEKNWEDPDFDLTQGVLQISFDGEMDLSSFSDLNFYVELASTPGKLQGQRDLIEFGGNYNNAVILKGVS